MSDDGKTPKDTQKDTKEILEQGMFPTPAASELQLAPSDYQHIFHEPSKLHTPEHAAGTSTGGQQQAAGIPTIPQVRQQTQQEQQHQQIAQRAPTASPQVRAETVGSKNTPQAVPKENVFQGLNIPGLPPNMIPMLMTDAQGVQRVVLVPMSGMSLPGSLSSGTSLQSAGSHPTTASAAASPKQQSVPQPPAPRPQHPTASPTITSDTTKSPLIEEIKATTPVATSEPMVDTSHVKVPQLLAGGQQAVITSSPTVLTTELHPPLTRPVLALDNEPAQSTPAHKAVKSQKAKVTATKTAKPKTVGKKAPAAAATPPKRMSSPECLDFLREIFMGTRKFEDPWEQRPYPDYKPQDRR